MESDVATDRGHLLTVFAARATLSFLLYPVDLMQLFYQIYLPDPKEFAFVEKGDVKVAVKMFNRMVKKRGLQAMWKGFTLELLRIAVNMGVSVFLTQTDMFGGGIKGFLGGQLFKSFVMTPFVVLKNRYRAIDYIEKLEERVTTRAERSIDTPKTVWELFKHMIGHEGIMGFLKGVQASIASITIQFFTTLGVLIVLPTEFLTSEERITAARLASCIFSYPFDTLSKKMQFWDYASYEQCAKQIWKREALWGRGENILELIFGSGGIPLPVPTRGFFSGVGLAIWKTLVTCIMEPRVAAWYDQMQQDFVDFVTTFD